MADNVGITAGSGTTVATDQVATGEHVQYVKLMDGTADGTGKIAGDAANGLDVDVTRVSGTVNVNPTGETAGVGIGAAADTSATNSVIGRLKALIALFPAALGAGGGLKVDGSGTALPVSGTVTANAGTGPFPVSDNAGSLTVDNGGTFAVQDSEKIADNAGFTDGTTKVQPVGFIFDEVAGTALTENDIGAARMDAKRAGVGVIEDATTRGQRAAVSAAGRLSVDASGVAVPVTDNASSLTVDAPVGTPLWVRLSDGAAAFVGQKAMAASIPVVIASDQTVVPVSDNAGSLTVDQGTAANLKAQVQGEAAQDAPVSGNPVLVGGRASAAVPGDMSADGDAVDAWMLRSGAQVVAQAPHLGMLANPYTLTSKTAQFTTAQTGVALWTPAAGKKIVITQVQVQVGGTVAGTFQLWFGGAADTAYTRGTDLAIFDGEFAPSATLKPGVIQSGCWISPTIDFILRVTDSAAINPLTVTVWGYEV